jgi:hypothetical protein
VAGFSLTFIGYKRIMRKEKETYPIINNEGKSEEEIQRETSEVDVNLLYYI